MNQERDEFEYRADHMTLDELESITADSEFYRGVIKKLLSRGSKLIVGPRGVGKTHQMRIAYKKALSDTTKPLPVYITLSKYLRLEPLKNSTSIAVQYFHCWVLCKVLLGVRETYENLSKDINPLSEIYNLDWNDIILFCEQIEKQQIRDWQNDLLEHVSVNLVSSVLEDSLNSCGRKHSILLCDDAALVLTKDYMIEFFDIFRALKSAKVSPKASVYPNTEFGPRFHVGQDAESVVCWPSIDDDEYFQLFDDIYTKRYQLDMKEDIKSCFMYAAFGVPRVFINLINQYQNSHKATPQSKVNSVISEQADIIMQEFKTLSSKQPQYKNYVNVGVKLINSIVSEISTANKKSLSEKRQLFFLGIQQSNTDNKTQKDIDLVVRLLEETGVLSRRSPVKHGQARIYDRFIPHFTLLINDGAYQVGRAGYVSNFSEMINYPKEKHPLRKSSFSEFLDSDDIDNLSLDLPSCSKCGNPRQNEEQRFCMYCGAELLNKSTFLELTAKKVEELPLTAWLKNKILEETRIETIADIIFASNPAQELRKAKGVGEKKAIQVINEASRVMEEFLS